MDKSIRCNSRLDSDRSRAANRAAARFRLEFERHTHSYARVVATVFPAALAHCCLGLYVSGSVARQTILFPVACLQPAIHESILQSHFQNRFMRRFDPKTPELRVHWLRFLRRKNFPRVLVNGIPLKHARLRLLMSVFLFANLAATTFSRPAVAQDSSAAARPPVARVRPVVNDYFGTKIADPYRYMEHLDNPEVANWMKAQNEYTRRVLARISGRDELRARIEQLDKSVPARIGGVVRLAGAAIFTISC